MDLTLTPEIEAAVRRLVESGRYANEIEALSAAVRLLEEEEHALAELREKAQLGVEAAERGDLFDGDEVLADLKRRHEQTFGPRKWRG